MSPITRGTRRERARRRGFTIGNLYQDRGQFKVHLKTTEFHSRLTLPSTALEDLGRKNKRIIIECGYSGVKFNCLYEYHVFDHGKRGVGRIVQGWSDVVDALSLMQGDNIYFDLSGTDLNKLHISVDKHEKCIKLEDEEWV